MLRLRTLNVVQTNMHCSECFAACANHGGGNGIGGSRASLWAGSSHAPVLRCVGVLPREVVVVSESGCPNGTRICKLHGVGLVPWLRDGMKKKGISVGPFVCKTGEAGWVPVAPPISFPAALVDWLP